MRSVNYFITKEKKMQIKNIYYMKCWEYCDMLELIKTVILI